MPLPAPHGGRLIDRRAAPEDIARLELERHLPSLPVVTLDALAGSDLDLIATGALSPLEGFMDRASYRSVVDQMRLPDGLPFPLPITLAVVEPEWLFVRPGQRALLVRQDGRVAGWLEVTDRFETDPPEEARRVFGTDDPSHPGVARLLGRGPFHLGGRVSAVWIRPPRAGLPCLTPAEVRVEIERRGWRRVVGFQTRNPVHRAHEYIQKCALESADGLLLHPLVGETKPDDIPAEVRAESYRRLLERYYPAERVLLSGFPAAMRYAGPREAVFHAICRKNYGCTHFVVGRDHAGVGQFYDPYDAHRIFDRFGSDELGIEPLRFENAFYCRRCGQMATSRTCPHGPEHRLDLSGTALRAMLGRGESPPPEVTRPEVARVLQEGLAQLAGAGRGGPGV